MSRDQISFSVLEMAINLHELMIPQRTMRPSIARLRKQPDPQFAASRHTAISISQPHDVSYRRNLTYTLCDCYKFGKNSSLAHPEIHNFY